MAPARAQEPSGGERPKGTTGGKTLPGLLSAKLKEKASKKASKKAPKREKPLQSTATGPVKTIEKKIKKNKKRVPERKQAKQKVRRQPALSEATAGPAAPVSGAFYANIAHKNVRKLVRMLDPADERGMEALIQCCAILNYKYKEKERMRVIRYFETFKPLKAKARKPPCKPKGSPAPTASEPTGENHTLSTPLEEAQLKRDMTATMVESVKRMMAEMSKETIYELLYKPGSAEGGVEEASELSQAGESESEMESLEETLKDEAVPQGTQGELQAEASMSEKPFEFTQDMNIFGDMELGGEEEEE